MSLANYVNNYLTNDSQHGKNWSKWEYLINLANCLFPTDFCQLISATWFVNWCLPTVLRIVFANWLCKLIFANWFLPADICEVVFADNWFLQLIFYHWFLTATLVTTGFNFFQIFFFNIKKKKLFTNIFKKIKQKKILSQMFL